MVITTILGDDCRDILFIYFNFFDNKNMALEFLFFGVHHYFIFIKKVKFDNSATHKQSQNESLKTKNEYTGHDGPTCYHHKQNKKNQDCLNKNQNHNNNNKIQNPWVIYIHFSLKFILFFSFSTKKKTITIKLSFFVFYVLSVFIL